MRPLSARILDPVRAVSAKIRRFLYEVVKIYANQP